MNRFASKVLYGTLIAGGLVLLGATAANAAETDGTDGTASGTQVVSPVTAPVAVGGNAITLVGDPTSAPVSAGGSSASPSASPSSSATTSGSDGTGSGTQVVPDVTAPITANGNSITLIGDPSAGSDGSTGAGTSSAEPGSGSTTSGTNGVLGGTQVQTGATAPVAARGNAITLVGNPSSSGSNSAPGTTGTGGGATTDGTDGAGSGSQVAVDGAVPVGVSDNSITLVGDPTTGSDSTPPTTSLTPAIVTGVATLAGLAVASLASTGVDPTIAALVGLLAVLAGFATTLLARQTTARL